MRQRFCAVNNNCSKKKKVQNYKSRKLKFPQCCFVGLQIPLTSKTYRKFGSSKYTLLLIFRYVAVREERSAEHCRLYGSSITGVMKYRCFTHEYKFVMHRHLTNSMEQPRVTPREIMVMNNAHGSEIIPITSAEQLISGAIAMSVVK